MRLNISKCASSLQIILLHSFNQVWCSLVKKKVVLFYAQIFGMVLTWRYNFCTPYLKNDDELCGHSIFFHLKAQVQTTIPDLFSFELVCINVINFIHQLLLMPFYTLDHMNSIKALISLSYSKHMFLKY